ncbi:hypothetical protein AK812_SmicGene29338 [Symbiodinium microadriaticum]|uniref:Uncharacterized protein n=1 Tax=Symbiodinium microadriaticum TaxID=2951 RepID=A0A1Q9D248_SYMMI|nr:hypothetical protein AK812_SmicGene29338 [Symbiodinium microadriaticum]
MMLITVTPATTITQIWGTQVLPASGSNVSGAASLTSGCPVQRTQENIKAMYRKQDRLAIVPVFVLQYGAEAL